MTWGTPEWDGKGPPADMIDFAVRAAMEGRCAKSKRGVVIYDPIREVAPGDEAAFAAIGGPPARVWSSAYNSPPHPFQCARDIPAPDANPLATCGERCRKLAVHAEERAILQALRDWPRRESHERIKNPRVRRDLSLFGLHLLHVKVVNGVAVPGGPPSCIQCSRLIVETGPDVWLWEGTPHFDRQCLSCKYVHSYLASTPDADLEFCPRCHRELEPLSTVRYEHPATWRLYTSISFHGATIRTLGLSTPS